MAHPHAGGENRWIEVRISFGAGSSPRGRGKPTPAAIPPRKVRLIPARAGKTSNSPAQCSSAWAHPRAGGENIAGIYLAYRRRGSSPRGRGKHLILRLSHIHRGLIPARAGKTAVAAIRADATPAHPRAGGENVVSATLPVGSPGSSPRGRGKRTLGSGAGFSLRLIPARAGKTREGHGQEPPPTGSSPRGRGKPPLGLKRHNNTGLIPARAGKTARSCGCRRRVRAHPRAGGENGMMVEAPKPGAGSSPRGRGKRVAPPTPTVSPGLIPARAGKTSSLYGSRSAASAHPRAGGENTFGARIAATAAGSSPRGRGKPRPRGWGKSPFRLIPARAGKTSRPPVAW